MARTIEDLRGASVDQAPLASRRNKPRSLRGFLIEKHGLCVYQRELAPNVHHDAMCIFGKPTRPSQSAKLPIRFSGHDRVTLVRARTPAARRSFSLTRATAGVLSSVK